MYRLLEQLAHHSADDASRSLFDALVDGID